MSFVPKTEGSGSPGSKPPIPPPPSIKSGSGTSSRPAVPAQALPAEPARVSVPWGAYLLAVFGLLAGGSGAYLAWETKKQAEEQIQAADQKIQATEKNLEDLRANQVDTRAALEKKIQEDTGKLRVQLEGAESQVQKLEEKGKVVSKELEVIAALKAQQQQMESRLASVDKTTLETSKRLEVTEAGLEDLKKKALKASLTAQTPGPKSPPVGMKLYLTREPLGVIAKSSGIAGEPAELAEKWKSLFTNPSGNAQGQRIENAVVRAAVATGVVGIDGAAEMQKVPPGDYYLLGATGQGNGFVYEKKIRVAKGNEDVLLNREDSANF